MTISNGSPILATDVGASFTPTLALQVAEAAKKQAVYYVYLDWRNLLAGTAVAARTSTIVVPDDCYLEEIAVQTVDLIGALTVALTGANLIQAISVTGVGAATAANPQKYTRVFADAAQPQQLLLKGSTITVVVTTADAAGTAQRLDVSLGFATFRRRL